MIAITSFSPQGFEIYGKKFLESAVNHWPTDIIVYTEDNLDFKHPKVSEVDLFSVYGLESFLHYCDLNPIFKGQTSKGYNFNYDCAKFARKAFAQFDALQKNQGKVFWLDADMVFKKDVPEEFLTNVFEDKTIAALFRKGLHAETGFVGFDTDKPDFKRFLDTYINLYRRGTLFKERYWIDGHAFQKSVFDSGVSYKNLSDFWKPDDTWKPNAAIAWDVLAKSVLSEYIVHNKGIRKYETIKLPESDKHFAQFKGKYQPDHINMVLNGTKRRGLALDVGAHVGFWSKELAKHFEEVISIEPNGGNYACLVENVHDIKHLNVACSNKTGKIGLRNPSPDNSGAWETVEGDEIPCITIDSLNVNPDLIKIDVQGHEKHVLEGAVETIKRSRPAIMVEVQLNGHINHDLIGFITSLGMKIAGSVKKDRLFLPIEET